MQSNIDEFNEFGFTKISLDDEIITSIRNELSSCISSRIDGEVRRDVACIFNEFHKLQVDALNDFRLTTIREFNDFSNIKNRLYESASSTIDSMIGPDLAVQKNINLSFQLPGDSSSTLSLHSDVWAGNSPFEMVLWIPFCDVERTKSLYILPRKNSLKYYESENIEGKTLINIFEDEKDNLVWPTLKFGEALVFSHALLHGNVVNDEPTTRVSLNMRLKSINSPYGSKSLGDYFIPLKFSPVSKLAWSLHGKW